MKGKYVVIGKNGEKYFYRTLGHAFNRFWKIYGADLIAKYVFDDSFIDSHLINLEA